MKRFLPHRAFPLIAVIPGLIGLLLRLALYTLEEPSGLLPHNHFLHIATVILAIITAVLAGFFSAKTKDGFLYVHERSPLATVGAILAALCLLPTAFGIQEQASGILNICLTFLTFLAVLCMLVLALLFWKGRRPHFLLHSGICLFFLIYTICQYPHWCANPQLADYLLPLLACVFLNFATYRRAAFDLHAQYSRKLPFFALMAGFFCICSLAGEGSPMFYLAGGLWALTNLCAVRPVPPQEVPHVPS